MGRRQQTKPFVVAQQKLEQLPTTKSCRFKKKTEIESLWANLELPKEEEQDVVVIDKKNFYFTFLVVKANVGYNRYLSVFSELTPLEM